MLKGIQLEDNMGDHISIKPGEGKYIVIECLDQLDLNKKRSMCLDPAGWEEFKRYGDMMMCNL